LGVPLGPLYIACLNAWWDSSVLAWGNSVHHVKNSTDFVHVLVSLRARPKDISVGLDVMSLFTKLPIREALNYLKRHCALTSPPFFLLVSSANRWWCGCGFVTIQWLPASI
jgi:hypothetical protein